MLFLLKLRIMANYFNRFIKVSKKNKRKLEDVLDMPLILIQLFKYDSSLISKLIPINRA